MVKKFFTVLLALLILVLAVPALAETVAPDIGTSSSTYTDLSPDELLQQWNQIGALLRENGNYPFVDLAKGDRGFEVTALQTRLAELGYYEKEIVDNYGKGTTSAMRAFEKANDLPVNGEASVKDQQALFNPSAIPYSKGNTSSGSGNNSSADSDATSGATSN